MNNKKQDILQYATLIATSHGVYNMTKQQIADLAQISPGSINYHYGTMDKLRRKVMRYAIRNEIANIVAEGILARDPIAMRAPKHLRQKAAAYIGGSV